MGGMRGVELGQKRDVTPSGCSEEPKVVREAHCRTRSGFGETERAATSSGGD